MAQRSGRKAKKKRNWLFLWQNVTNLKIFGANSNFEARNLLIPRTRKYFFVNVSAVSIVSFWPDNLDLMRGDWPRCRHAISARRRGAACCALFFCARLVQKRCLRRTCLLASGLGLKNTEKGRSKQRPYDVETSAVQPTAAGRRCYSLAYSDLACARTGTSGSASFHAPRKSW